MFMKFLNMDIKNNKIKGGDLVMKKSLSSKKGFTMVELVVVITILAILSVVGVQQVGNVINKSKASSDIANAKTIGDCLTRAMADEKLLVSSPIVHTSANAIDQSTAAANTNLSTALIGVLTAGAKLDMNAATYATSMYSTPAAGDPFTSYLTNIPAVKRYTGDWAVSVTTDGKVTVSSFDGTTYYQLYPIPSGGYTGNYKIMN